MPSTYSYDGLGRIEMIVRDYSGSIDTMHYNYTDNSSLYNSIRFERDTDDDGIVDDSWIQSFRYVETANQLTMTMDTDSDLDGSVDRRSFNTITYGVDRDQILSVVIGYDNDLDGQMDAPGSVKTKRYNDQGWPISAEFEFYYDGSRDEFSYSYNWETMTATKVRETFDSNGELTRTFSMTCSDIHQICSDNLANPHDPMQMGVGDIWIDVPAFILGIF